MLCPRNVGNQTVFLRRPTGSVYWRPLKSFHCHRDEEVVACLIPCWFLSCMFYMVVLYDMIICLLRFNNTISTLKKIFQTTNITYQIVKRKMHYQTKSLQSGVLGNVHSHKRHSSTYTSNHHHAKFCR